MKSVTPCVGKRYGWVDRPNHNIHVWKEIFLNKVQHEKCDLLLWEKVWLSWQTKPPLLYINQNLAKKMRRRKCNPLGPVDRPDFHNYVLIEILLKKVRRRKCDPLGPVVRPNLHNCILIEILLKKVRLRKCDHLGPIDRPYFHNYKY